MPVETAQFPAQLVEGQPTGLEKKKEGDNHIRLLKEVLKFTFPGLDHAVLFGGWEGKNAGSLNFTTNEPMVPAHDGQLLHFDVTSGNRTYTLMSLADVALPEGMFVMISRDITSDNTLTIDGSSAETINGQATIALRKGEMMILGRRATEWSGFICRSLHDFLTMPVVSLLASGLALRLRVTNDDALAVELDFDKVSTTPAVDDFIARLNFRGRNNALAQEEVIYGGLYCKISDPVDGTEDGVVGIRSMRAGVLSDWAFARGALSHASLNTPTEDGAFNTTKLYVNNIPTGFHMLNRAYQEIVGPSALLTGQIDLDDTTPGIAEGDLLFSQAWTAKIVGSRIKISGHMNWCHESGAGAEVIFALFRDSVCVRAWRGEETSNSVMSTPIHYEETSVDTLAHTFTLRWGASTAAGHTLNVGADGSDLGDKIASTFLVEEFINV